MDAVTYPNDKVIGFINENLVALRLPYDHDPLAKKFQVKWTPTLVILDAEGQEHHRSVGFVPPEELIPMLILAAAKTHFDRDNFEGAKKNLEVILESHARSNAAPEAIYLYGVSRYKSSHDAKPLKEAYEKLQAKYPDSEWTQRAAPYRLL